MNLQAGTRHTKRRRLNVVVDSQVQAAARPSSPHPQFHMGMDSHLALSEPGRYNYGAIGPADGACHSANPNGSARRDFQDVFGQKVSECCYGMVCRHLMPSSHASVTLLIDPLHSYATYP